MYRNRPVSRRPFSSINCLPALSLIERGTLSTHLTLSKGRFVLPSSRPPENRDAISHGPAGSASPNRNTHALPVIAIASNASATPPPAGMIAPSSGSSTTAQRVKCARISSARPANLRSQPRTVSGYAPNRAAIDRNPSPATFASIADPITATSSCRRKNASCGNNTCVPAQPRHRARRGRNNLFPDRQRSTRSLACPHGPSTPRHDGQPNNPPTSSASTNTSSVPTINIGCHLRHQESPPDAPLRTTGGLSRVHERAKPANATTTTNGTITPTGDQTQRRSTQELLAGTEKALGEIKRRAEAGTLQGQAEIGLQVGAVWNRYKVKKHFQVTITDDTLTYERKQEQIALEAELDGIYVIRAGRIDPEELAAAGIVRAYKQLKEAEKGFGGLKGPLEVRPIHHRLEDRVRSHLLICMLAEYVRWHLRHAWAELLFQDHTPASNADPVAKATRSPEATRKAGRRRTLQEEPCHTIESLLDELENRTRNTIRVKGTDATFPQLSTPTDLQAHALALINERVPQIA